MSQDIRPKMRREIIIRLSRLLNMRYKPSELAQEIGVNVDTVYRTYMHAGCPFERDKRNQIWIIGTEFAEWARAITAQSKRKPGQTLPEGQAWCLRCRGAVDILNPKVKSINRYLDLVQGTCAACGAKVNRARGKEGK